MRIIPLVLILACGAPYAFADGPGSAATGSGSALVVSTGSGSAVTPAPTPAPAPVATLPDVNADPAAALSTESKLWHSGTIPAAVILGAFFLLAWLSVHVKWFQDGHRAVIVAAVLGGLTMIAGSVANGTTPNLQMVGSAVVTALALWQNPKKPAVDAAKADAAKST